MTKRLEQAVERLKLLPADRQNAIADRLLDELDEDRWERSFAASPDLLSELAEEAMVEHRRGETRDLDLSSM
ncbi:MAG: hypothetical protein AAGC60_12215 [Acidobacteriota bacterium]